MYGLQRPHGRRCVMPLVPVDVPASISHQAAVLLVLAIPIACMSWTVTHEEVFREPREFCKEKSQSCGSLPQRKFFYLFTCEYCFSHYVTAFVLVLSRFHLIYLGWRGYLLSEFALVFVANVYMSLFNRLRLDIKHENVTIAVEQQQAPDAK